MTGTQVMWIATLILGNRQNVLWTKPDSYGIMVVCAILCTSAVSSSPIGRVMASNLRSATASRGSAPSSCHITISPDREVKIDQNIKLTGRQNRGRWTAKNVTCGGVGRLKERVKTSRPQQQRAKQSSGGIRDINEILQPVVLFLCVLIVEWLRRLCLP